MSRRNRNATPEPVVRLDIESLDLDGQGVAHHEGKVMFVRGALPGETVEARVVRRKPRFEVAETVQVLRPASVRVTPGCPHFGVCGGCATQHIDARAQVAFKQRVLEDALWHMARLRPQQVLPIIEGPTWGYRHRARLTVRNVVRKGGVLVGFHERGSSFVADMSECHVLPPAMSALLVPLRRLVEALSIRERMPQIEMAIGDALDGDGGSAVPSGVICLRIALVFRILDPITAEDGQLLRDFGDRHGLDIWLQPKGPDTVHPLIPGTPRPSYRLPEFGLRMSFAPTEFTQVNAAINRQLIRRALNLLAPGPDDRVLDLFCGLGNFTLPLATRSRRVMGIEGSAALIERARENARVQQERLLGQTVLGGDTWLQPAGDPLADPPDGVRFAVADLFQFTHETWEACGPVDRVLIDPPRDGALAVCRVLAQHRAAHYGAPPPRSERSAVDTASARDGAASAPAEGSGAATADAAVDEGGLTGAAVEDAPAAVAPPVRVARTPVPSRIVYVSCNPATLARDAAILVHEGGWRLTHAGIVNMFPHTAHVESIAVFEALGESVGREPGETAIAAAAAAED